MTKSCEDIKSNFLDKKIDKDIPNDSKEYLTVPKSSDKKNNNYITSEFYIKKNEVNKDVRIINSYEANKRDSDTFIFKDNFKNENEIKNCEITINNQLIPFNYIHKFKSSGKYIYSFILNDSSYEFNILISLLISSSFIFISAII